MQVWPKLWTIVTVVSAAVPRETALKELADSSAPTTRLSLLWFELYAWVIVGISKDVLKGWVLSVFKHMSAFDIYLYIKGTLSARYKWNILERSDKPIAKKPSQSWGDFPFFDISPYIIFQLERP